MRVRAQEHQHKTDSTNNIVLYFKIDGAILDSTYMGNNESLKKLDELIKNELIIPNLDSITIVYRWEFLFLGSRPKARRREGSFSWRITVSR